jgi:general secretion pathway protein H
MIRERRRRVGSAGFTLLEIAVVLLVVGLLVMLVVPRLSVLGSVALDVSARRLAARVRYLREEAALRGRPIRLVFDPREGSYAASVLVTSDAGGHFVDEETPLFRRVSLPDGVHLDLAGPNLESTLDGRPATVFSPDGFADPTVIYLDDGRGRAISIVIESAIPSPRIIDGRVDPRSLATP